MASRIPTVSLLSFVIALLLDTANVFRGKHVPPIGGYFFFGNVNSVVNCKGARWDDDHERMRGSGKEKKIVGIAEGLFGRRKKGGLRYVMWFVGSL